MLVDDGMFCWQYFQEDVGKWRYVFEDITRNERDVIVIP